MTLVTGLELMGANRGVVPIFNAPFDDPDSPIRMIKGGPLTMVRATDGTFLNPKTGLTEVAGNDILRIEANGALIEGQRTNQCLQSRGFDTTWTRAGELTLAQDRVGFDGVANSAWAVTDDGEGSTARLNQIVTIANDGATHVFAVFIEKDDDETRFPEVLLNLVGGTNQTIATQINTKTGASANRIEVGGTTGEVVDFSSTHWRVVLTVTNNTSGNGYAYLYLYPARGVTLGVVSDAATGTTVFDAAQLEFNSAFASSPIYTTVAAVTRNADVLTFPSAGNISDTAGTAVVSVSPYTLDAGGTRAILVGDANNRTMYAQVTEGGSNNVRMFDGTAVTSQDVAWVVGALNKLASRWSGSVTGITANGTSVTVGSYDGGITTATMSIGNHGVAAEIIFGHIKNLKIYDVALTDAQMIAKTS